MPRKTSGLLDSTGALSARSLSPRERLVGLLAGNSKPAYQGLMGLLGQSSAATPEAQARDMINPIGGLFGMYDAGQDLGNQQYLAGGVGLMGMAPGGKAAKKIKNKLGQTIDAPRSFFRGTNPESTERIRTGADDWDSYLFAADNEKDARLYGHNVQNINAKPEAKILYEGTAEWNKIAGKWRKGESLLQYADRASKAAKEAGYDAAWFKRQGDVGTAIFNPDKFEIVKKLGIAGALAAGAISQIEAQELFNQGYQ